MNGILAVTLVMLMIVLLIGCFAIDNKKYSKYLIFIASMISAYFIGLILDANTSEFMALRIVLPMVAMGLCILNVVGKSKK